jgi:hypothetical protein
MHSLHGLIEKQTFLAKFGSMIDLWLLSHQVIGMKMSEHRFLLILDASIVCIVAETGSIGPFHAV